MQAIFCTQFSETPCCAAWVAAPITNYIKAILNNNALLFSITTRFIQSCCSICDLMKKIKAILLHCRHFN